MAGSLPLKAILDMRQLGLFAMISRLKDNTLRKVAKHLLTISPDTSPSWFIQIQKICNKYQLPQPLTILECPPSKEAFKHLTRTNVHRFWEEELRNDAARLDSLVYFKPQLMSLSSRKEDNNIVRDQLL